MPSQKTLVVIGTGLAILLAVSAIARQFVGQNRCAEFGKDFVLGTGCVDRKAKEPGRPRTRKAPP